MSSVRISQHNRPDATSGSGGETSRPDAPPGGGSFAVTLGAAAVIPKGSGTALFGAQAKDAVDGTTASRKRTGADGKGADAAVVLAAQASLLAVAGQVPVSSHDAVDAHAASATASDGDPTNAAVFGTGLPAEEIAPISTAPGNDAANVLLRPLQATNAPALATTSDGSAPAAAAVEGSGATSNLGPELPTAPGLNLPPALPPALAGTPAARPSSGPNSRPRRSIGGERLARDGDAAVAAPG